MDTSHIYDSDFLDPEYYTEDGSVKNESTRRSLVAVLSEKLNLRDVDQLHSERPKRERDPRAAANNMGVEEINMKKVIR